MHSNRLQIIGYSEEEIKKINAFKLIHPEDRENISIKLKNLKINESEVFEYRFLSKNEKYIYLQTEISLINDKLKTPIAYLTNSQEITAKKEIEVNLLKSRKFSINSVISI